MGTQGVGGGVEEALVEDVVLRPFIYGHIEDSVDLQVSEEVGAEGKLGMYPSLGKPTSTMQEHLVISLYCTGTPRRGLLEPTLPGPRE